MTQGCPHKHKILICKECQMNCCAKCIQLEAHKCPMLHTRIQAQKKDLEVKLVKVVAAKISSF